MRVRNDGDHETTVHWHGLRLDNAYDGVPYETQAPIPVGGEFIYRLRFPDDGVYWYHPHVREDYGLEMGLYGNIIVDPPTDYWPAVNREVVVTLDDILLEDGRIAPFHRGGPTHTAMGRFGNVMLTGGSTDLALEAQAGEVVRFFFTNTANTRIFNVSIPGTRMKLVGGDSGRYEHETCVDEVLLAPSERAVVDVLFDTRRHVPDRAPDARPHLPARLRRWSPTPRHDVVCARQFEELRTSEELASGAHGSTTHAAPRTRHSCSVAHADPLRRQATRPRPSYTCPMHPEVIQPRPGTCPKCGMKLVPPPTTYVCPMHPEVT